MYKIGGMKLGKRVATIVLAALAALLAGAGIFIGSIYFAHLVNDDTTFIVGDAKEAVIAAVVAILFILIIATSLWNFRRFSILKYFSLFLLLPIIACGIYLFTNASILMSYRDVQRQASERPTVCSTPEKQYQKARDAIVPIITSTSAGTGFVIDNKGTVLTAYHVIEGASAVYTNDSGDLERLEVIRTSPKLDIALLKLNRSTPEHFKLSSKYTTADQVMAYGYPGNALDIGTPSLTKGIISRVITSFEVRQLDGELSGLEVIQTDAAINPGNSGGPLIGSCGVVGIVWSVSDTERLSEYLGIVSEQGIGYAVSAKTAARAFDLDIHSGN